jgi:hypothetical protein
VALIPSGCESRSKRRKEKGSRRSKRLTQQQVRNYGQSACCAMVAVIKSPKIPGEFPGIFPKNREKRENYREYFRVISEHWMGADISCILEILKRVLS